MSIYEQGIIITPPQIQRTYWEKRCTEIKSKQKKWWATLNPGHGIAIVSWTWQQLYLYWSWVTLLPECFHAANVARRRRDIFFGDIVTDQVLCSCDQPLTHSSLSKPKETHWATQRKGGRIKGGWEETILERGLVGKERWSVGMGQEKVRRNKYQNVLYTCMEMS